MKRVYDFLKKAEVYYLATVEGDQPRVRPFGTVNEFEGKLYMQTGKVKPTSQQLVANPKVEICAFTSGEWIRVACELVVDDRFEAKKSMLDASQVKPYLWEVTRLKKAKSSRTTSTTTQASAPVIPSFPSLTKREILGIPSLPTPVAKPTAT